MNDDRMQPEANAPLEQAKPEQVDQQAQQSQASPAATAGQRTVPGRKPLFGTEARCRGWTGLSGSADFSRA